jgi:hypothetical protein
MLTVFGKNNTRNMVSVLSVFFYEEKKAFWYLLSGM